MRNFESLHSLLGRHCSELGELGHSALPLLFVKLSELPMINYSIRFGEEFSQKIVNLYQENQVLLLSIPFCFTQIKTTVE